MFGLSDERKLGLAAIGSGLSQLGAGQAVNLASSPAAKMLEQRKQQTALQESGILQRFSPEQRAILAQMPPAAAMQVIAGDAFKPPMSELQRVQLDQAKLNYQRDLEGANIDPATVQSSVPLDDGTIVMVMNDGTRRVLGPTGEELTGRDAANAIMTARDYTTENQRDIYEARQSGTLDARIQKGGEAAASEDVAKATVSAGIEAWSDYGKLQSSLGNIGEAIAAIDGGAESGLVYSYLPDVTLASASLSNAMDRMGLDVIGSVTFGALSEGEMRLAMNTAVPRGLAPPELREWLVKKQAAQQKAADMLADAAQFMTKPGNTINDWIAKNRQAKKADDEKVDEGLPNFVEMSDEELEAWIKANGG